MRKLIKFISLFILLLIVCSCANVNEVKTKNDHPFNEPPKSPSTEILPPAAEPKSEINNDINDNPGNVEVTDDYKITLISGTDSAFYIEEDTIYFNEIKSDTIYSITGTLDGNIVIDVGDGYKFELEFNNFTVTSNTHNPITILSGDEVQITAKKDSRNYIYDYREKIDSTDDTLFSAAIYSLVDLGGKGRLEIFSQNNNGVHTKDDLKIKNIDLNVVCIDNALKGNDSVTIESGNVKLVSKAGDGIKTTNSHINSNENQKGNIIIKAATVDIYAACDGIDAAHDFLIEEGGAVLNIYTDKYSGYSDVESEVDTNDFIYIRYSNKSFNFSVKFCNSQTNEYLWQNATYYQNAGRYYYYKVNKPVGYDKMVLYMYNSNQTPGQETNFYKSYNLTTNHSYDTVALSTRGTCEWTFFSNNQGGFGGPGGMQEGNSDKGEYSTKGIKADNQIKITNGTIKINSYDDCIHANNTATLENGNTSLGIVLISGGNLTLYSNDDGIHADGNVNINGGSINITNSYEGIEGTNVIISGGNINVVSKDDGINATAKSATSITFTGGKTFIYASGDGVDSNSTASYSGISFAGGDVIIISNSGGNSAIDSERGYSYTLGRVIAIMPSGGMSGETTNCSNFSSVGTKLTNQSLKENNYITLNISSNTISTFKMPCTITNAMVVYLGATNAKVSSSTEVNVDLNNGVYWN